MKNDKIICMIEDTITLNVIQEAKNEDRLAMEEMIRSYTPVLTYIASCHLKSEALVKSIVRKCLGNLFVLLTQIDDLSKFSGKAMSMVVRTCLNAALSEDKDNDLFPLSGSDPSESSVQYEAHDETAVPNRQYTEKGAMNIVVKMLRRLPDDQRIVFVMRYLDGYSFERISGMVHLSEELLMKRAQLAKRHLSEALSHTIPEIFGIIQLAEENKYLVLEEEPSEPSSTQSSQTSIENAPEAPEETSAPEAKTRISSPVKPASRALWIGGGCVLTALSVLVLAVLKKPAEVSLLNGIQCSFTGVNGAGSAEVTIRETDDHKFDEVLKDTECALTDRDGNTVQEGTLSNGDQVTYSCTFDEQALKKAHLRVSDGSASFTVEGLPEPEKIDLFEDVYVYAEVDEESGVIYLYAAPRDSKFKEVYYKVVSEEDNEIVIYADISDELLLSYGLVAKDHYHTYDESVLPEEIKSLYHRQLINRSIENSASYRDEYGREVANGSDADINELAQSFIGKGGACNEIANAFIYSLYGVRVHTGYSRDNLYEVDSPEAGDLIYYYDSAGNYRHVATYIGNGLVLNGNYGDGTAHITSMYESWYAENPMVFLRVQR